MKKTLKAILPVNILSYCKKNIFRIKMAKSYIYDYKRYNTYSRTKGNNTSEKLIGEIITIYHVIEKGLTMPEPRLGFGEERIIKLCELCNQYINKYDTEEKQLIHGMEVILEYENFHQNNKFELSTSVQSAIKKLKLQSINLSACKQREITKETFFRNRLDSFQTFSNSRASVRNFTNENIPIENILKTLKLAQNSPSACNRQSWRTYVFSEKKQIEKILELQGGNRGFGHLTNKLIVIAGEVGVFNSIAERNQVYIDGGMYAMNLLYSFHFHKIAGCILNCSHSPEKDIAMRNLCKTKESEIFIAMIVCGIPPESFKVAISQRHSLIKTNTIV